jgi:hypothetical protein
MTVKSSLDKGTEKQEKKPEEKENKPEGATVKETENKTEEAPPETPAEAPVEKPAKTPVETPPEEKPKETPVETPAETPAKTKPEESKLSEVDQKIALLEDKLAQMNWRLTEKKPGDVLKVRSVEQLDPKDILDEPKIYFCFLVSYEMYGYTKNGIEILTPYGRPIRFEFFTRHERPSRSGKGMESISVSRALIHSIKEAEWVETHPEFGNRIFSDAKQVGTIDIAQQQKMSEISKTVSQLDDHQLIVRARAEQLTIIQDIVKLRQQLIQHLTDKEIKLQRQKIESEVQEMATVREKSEGLRTAAKSETA